MGMPPAPKAVERLLGERKPQLMVTDPPYGISLDSEWRDRAGLKVIIKRWMNLTHKQAYNQDGVCFPNG